MAETRTVTVELASGKTYEIDDVVEDTFALGNPAGNHRKIEAFAFVLGELMDVHTVMFSR